LALVDRFQRMINYLRISVTDRCNYRCVYCMPPEGVPWRPHAEILRFEEIVEIVRASAELGITRIRLTGGEPLVRKGLASLVRMIADIPGIEDISMTTNAHLLADQAGSLADAGLQRINVSLDTLEETRFSQMTRGGSLRNVWQGILAAEKAGLRPIKINAVVIRGVNDGELIDLARLSLDHDWQIRFIEYMPVDDASNWGMSLPVSGSAYVSVRKMREALEPLHLEEIADFNGNGPARIYRLPGGIGSIGFISPIGEHFCQTCNRLRLTADGNLKLCLLHEDEIPLRDALKNGEDLRPYLLKAVGLKPEGHTLTEEELHSSRKMSQIGG
jgi:GTP 3',8-cyclase